MDKRYLGRMNDPTASARVTGPCGDSMEIYLVVSDGRIEMARYFTEGCDATHMFGSAVAERVEGMTAEEALGVSAAEIMASRTDADPDHRHCAILAVSTMYRAVADYMLKL